MAIRTLGMGGGYSPTLTNGAAHVTTAGSPGTTAGAVALFDNGTTGQTLATVTTSTGAVALTHATHVAKFTFDADEDFRHFELACAQMPQYSATPDTSVPIGAYAVAVINPDNDAAAEAALEHTMNDTTDPISGDRILIVPGQMTAGIHGAAITEVHVAAIQVNGPTAGDREGLVVAVRVGK